MLYDIYGEASHVLSKKYFMFFIHTVLKRNKQTSGLFFVCATL